MERRNAIFNESDKCVASIQKPRRSTLRLRKYFRLKKIARKILISAIISNSSDKRFYAQVSFLDLKEYGLLDTGANISCVGSELANYPFHRYPNFVRCKSVVRTADGKTQEVKGWVEVDISFKGQTKPIKLFIIPTISSRLILGIDFWKSFNLVPNIISSVDIFENPLPIDESSLIHKPEFDRTEDLNSECTEPFVPLSSDQRSQLDVVISMFPNFEKQGLGRTNLIKHRINIGNASPIKQRFYPVSPAVEKIIYKEIDRMLDLGVIEESSSPWSSPMRLVLKPGKVRLCLDARKLNSVTQKDAYPLPNIDGIFARLPKAQLISKIDLKDAYWQIALEEESKAYTAFTIPGRPLYQFVVMPFGLCSAPQTMSRLMDQLIPPDLKHSVFGYLDDLIIVSENFSNHLEVLMRIAAQFRKANLTINVAKSKFCVVQVKYLGYVIGNGGISTDPDKVTAILNWPVPKNLKQVRGFLGLAGWYRRFVENFSTIVAPISDLVSNKSKFRWTSQAQEAFDKVKMLLTTAPILANPDFSRKFFVHCDASNYGIGAVLVQLDDEGNERPIAYMSRKLNTAQRNYSVTERECLAAIEAIHKFRCYIEMQEFEVITDHSSLLWLLKQPDLSGRLARWVFKLQSYSFSISHRKGKDNIVPDALSRIPEHDLASLDVSEQEIDLNSPHFYDPDYQELKNKILCNQSKYPDIKLVDNYIYIRTGHYSGDDEQDDRCWKLWIPFNLRQEVLSRAHDSPICAHGGMTKTIHLLRRNFFWPGLVKDVREYVRKCETCKATKAPNFIMKPPMGNPIISCRPFQRLYIDFLGPYPRSKSGYVGMFIVLDHFSKFHWLCKMRAFKSKTVIEFMESQIFHMYGVPECVVSDNGTQFRANDFNAFLTSYGVKHIYTALYSPQSNASERVNRSIIAGIRAYIKKDHQKWDETISAISCALRNAYHETIRTSPYHSLYGIDMITHGSSYQLLRNLQLLDEPRFSLGKDDTLHLQHIDMRKFIQDAHNRTSKQYNLRCKPQSFQIGQEVFRRNFAQSSAEKKFNAKLSPMFIKARVREKVGNNYYVLEDLQGKLDGTYHSKDIRP